MAHEVRNPLAIVRATAQLLAGQAGENSSLRQYTRVLTSESDRIEQLISDLGCGCRVMVESARRGSRFQAWPARGRASPICVPTLKVLYHS